MTPAPTPAPLELIAELQALKLARLTPSDKNLALIRMKLRVFQHGEQLLYSKAQVEALAAHVGKIRAGMN